jgi:hypothetical protein
MDVVLPAMTVVLACIFAGAVGAKVASWSTFGPCVAPKASRSTATAGPMGHNPISGHNGQLGKDTRRPKKATFAAFRRLNPVRHGQLRRHG